MKKIGRNDLCPCGSNLKYKLCCLKTEGRATGRGTFAIALQNLRAGRLLQAEEGCRLLLEQDPGNPDALHLSGMVAHRARDYQRAIEMMNRSISVAPGQPVYYCNLGNVYKELRRYDEAASCYQNALSFHPDYVEAINNLGLTRKEQGRLSEAVEAYHKAITLGPRFAPGHFNLGDALRQLGREEDAMASFRAALDIDPALRRLIPEELAGLKGAP